MWRRNLRRFLPFSPSRYILLLNLLNLVFTFPFPHFLTLSNDSRRLTPHPLHETTVKSIEKEDIQHSLLASTSVMTEVLTDQEKENAYVQTKIAQYDAGKEQELLILNDTALSPSLRALKVLFFIKKE